ncbi:MAG: NAD-dependent epimerase/dehydratase family protein [Fuerstiella sp.]
MRALVTGGGGFLGQYLVEQLLSAGHEVRVFSRGAYPELTRLGATVVQGDLRNAPAVSDACATIEAVFHTAAIPGIWGSWQTYHDINTVGTQNVIDACRRHRVPRLIHTSSPSVVFDGSDHIDANESLPYPTKWLCHYPHSKALAEQFVLAANSDDLKTVSLRPHLIWGKRDNHLIPRLLQKARSGRLRIVGNGENQVSMINVENAAAAHVQAERELRGSAKCQGKAYFINEEERVNLWNWINEILGRAKIAPITKQISATSAYRIGAALETIWKVLPGEPPMTRFVASQLATSHVYRIQNAINDFGFHPIISVEDGMQKMQTDFKF